MQRANTIAFLWIDIWVEPGADRTCDHFVARHPFGKRRTAEREFDFKDFISVYACAPALSSLFILRNKLQMVLKNEVPTNVHAALMFRYS